MLIDGTTAQDLFDSLPDAMRWPTLSPDYVIADARRDPALRPTFMADRGDDDALLMHSVHEAEVEGADVNDWQSAYGYGGPLVRGLDDSTGLAAAWGRLHAHAMEHRIVAEFVRFHPALHNEQSYPGTTRQDRAVVMIDLGVPDLLASYCGRARTAVRKAERLGLQARWEGPEDARQAFPGFYRERMVEIGAHDFYQFGDPYFDALLALPGARVLSVQRDEELLSMGLFLFGPVQVEYHLSGTTAAGRSAGATNLLLHEAAGRAQAEGRHWLYLGGGTSSRDDDPLLHFKSSFAVPRMHFHVGHRIHDARAYEQLRAAHPLLASSGRILFYRR